MKAVNPSNISIGDIERQLRTMRSNAGVEGQKEGNDDSEFSDLLKHGLKEINATIKESEAAGLDLASGKPVNLHETMLAVTKAELALNMAVQMRNKTVEAYQEVMRMQV